MNCWNCKRDDKTEYVPNVVEISVENGIKKTAPGIKGLWRCNRCHVWTDEKGEQYGGVPLLRLLRISRYRDGVTE